MYNMCYKTVLNFKQMSCSAHTGQHLHMQASCRALQLLGEHYGASVSKHALCLCVRSFTLYSLTLLHTCAAKCYSVRLSFTVTLVICYVINPRRACAARVTVVVLCVCLSVCLSATVLALQATRRLMSDTNSFSATRARKSNVTISLKRLRSRDMA